MRKQKSLNYQVLLKLIFLELKKIHLELVLNQIGDIQLKLSKPLLVDSYSDNKSNGSFILINPKTNNTVGVGFIK